MLSHLQYMRFGRWAAIRASPAWAGPFNCLRALYESCTNSDMLGRVGRFMSGKVGLCRIMSGEVGREIFPPAFLAVTVLHQFFRFRIMFPVPAGSLRYSSTTLTDDRHMPASWRWGAGRRVRLHKVGLCRVRAGSIPFPGLLRLTSSTFPRCLCWVLGSHQSWKRFPSPSDFLPARVGA